jgi:hypothetical protein
MNIGNTIKTHDNGFIGNVVTVEPTLLTDKLLRQVGLTNGYVAYTVEYRTAESQSEFDTDFTTAYAKNDSEIQSKYVLA